MLAIRQTDVHRINTIIGQEVFIGGVHSFWFKSCRSLFIAASNGVQVCAERSVHGWGESAAGNVTGTEKPPVDRH
jgi:predicted phosphohydrolase